MEHSFKKFAPFSYIYLFTQSKDKLTETNGNSTEMNDKIIFSNMAIA